MESNKDELMKFLKVASGQKEVALVIAQDETELQELQQFLKKDGFIKVDRTSELLNRMDKPGKLLFTFSGTINKHVYDFLMQYSTGQVEIFDHSKMQSQIAIPDYRLLSVVALITKQNLLELEKQGYSIRINTGVAYQT